MLTIIAGSRAFVNRQDMIPCKTAATHLIREMETDIPTDKQGFFDTQKSREDYCIQKYQCINKSRLVDRPDPSGALVDYYFVDNNALAVDYVSVEVSGTFNYPADSDAVFRDIKLHYNFIRFTRRFYHTLGPIPSPFVAAPILTICGALYKVLLFLLLSRR